MLRGLRRPDSGQQEDRELGHSSTRSEYFTVEVAGKRQPNKQNKHKKKQKNKNEVLVSG